MRIEEYGRRDAPVLMLLHSEAFRWDRFLAALPALTDHFRVLIPAMSGFDERFPKEHFEGVEHTARSLVAYLYRHKMLNVDGLYGLSLGGSVALQMLRDEHISVRRVVLDGCVMPSEKPPLLTKCQVLGKRMLLHTQKRMTGRLMARVSSVGPSGLDELMEKHRILETLSNETISQVSRSCLCAPVPKSLPGLKGNAVYWYGQGERQDRETDIQFIYRHFPEIPVLVLKGMRHGELLFETPELFGRYLDCVIREDGYMPGTEPPEKNEEQAGEQEEIRKENRTESFPKPQGYLPPPAPETENSGEQQQERIPEGAVLPDEF